MRGMTHRASIWLNIENSIADQAVVVVAITVTTKAITMDTMVMHMIIHTTLTLTAMPTSHTKAIKIHELAAVAAVTVEEEEEEEATVVSQALRMAAEATIPVATIPVAITAVDTAVGIIATEVIVANPAASKDIMETKTIMLDLAAAVVKTMPAAVSLAAGTEEAVVLAVTLTVDRDMAELL